jgi:O-antigen ligase
MPNESMTRLQRVPGRARARDGGADRVDLLLHGSAALLLLGGCGWLLLAADATGGDAWGTCGILALVALSYGASRGLTRRIGLLVPLLILVGAAVLALVNAPVLFSHPGGGPLGYSNAAGSFFMLAAAAGLIVVARASDTPVRIAAACLSLPFAAVPWLNGTFAATVLVSLLPLGLLARRPGAVRWSVAAGGACAMLSLVFVLLMGATYRPGAPPGAAAEAVDATLSTRRVMLWSDAVRLFVDHPLAGVGPGRFPLESPTARAHPDTAWPHNEVLHFAAEAGVFGVVLVIGLFACGFARLWSGAGDAGAAVAALALGAAGVHANVDYVLHYPAVTLVLAALVGTGSCLPLHPARHGLDRPRRVRVPAPIRAG